MHAGFHDGDFAEFAIYSNFKSTTISTSCEHYSALQAFAVVCPVGKIHTEIKHQTVFRLKISPSFHLLFK